MMDNMTEDQAYEALQQDLAKCCHRCLGRNEPHTTCHPSYTGDHTKPWSVRGFEVLGSPELSEHGYRQFDVRPDDLYPWVRIEVLPDVGLDEALKDLEKSF